MTNPFAQTDLYNAVYNIGMVDIMNTSNIDRKTVEIINTSNLDTDMEMPDAPPLECYRLDNWINKPLSRFRHATRIYSNGGCQQNFIVAERIPSANTILSRID
jgi:hypothetical protein